MNICIEEETVKARCVGRIPVMGSSSNNPKQFHRVSEKKRYLCQEMEIQGSPKKLSKPKLPPLFCKGNDHSVGDENIYSDESLYTNSNIDPSIDSKHIGDTDGNRWPS